MAQIDLGWGAAPLRRLGSESRWLNAFCGHIGGRRNFIAMDADKRRQYQRLESRSWLFTIADDNRALLDKLCERLVAAGATCDVLLNTVGRD